MTWEIVSTTVVSRLKGTTESKKKSVVRNAETDQAFVVLHWPGMPCVVYDMDMDEILSKYSWWYSKPTGYMYAHHVDEEGNKISVTMHAVLMRHHQGPPLATQSVDHMNYVKTHNVLANLRYVSQSEQNTNRERRSDKQAPPSELQKIGIAQLPRYIRFDFTEDKFVIERNHPGFAVLTAPFNSSGTKSETVSIVYKYYDVLKKLEFLNQQVNTPERRAQLDLQAKLHAEYRDISKLITGTDVPPITYDNTICDYRSLEEHLTEADKAYQPRSLPADGEINVSMLPKYFNYTKAGGNRGDFFYISRKHPHLKAIGVTDIKSTSSKTVSLRTKYDSLMVTYAKVDTLEGDALRAALN